MSDAALRDAVLQAIEDHYGGDVFVLDDMLAVLTDLAGASIAGVSDRTERGVIVHRLVHALIANIETRAATGDVIAMERRPRTLQ